MQRKIIGNSVGEEGEGVQKQNKVSKGSMKIPEGCGGVDCTTKQKEPQWEGYGHFLEPHIVNLVKKISTDKR